MEQIYQIIQKQKQLLSQQQFQSLNILTMDNVELDLFLKSEYLENPMLEYRESQGGTYSEKSFEKTSEDESKWNQNISEPEDLKKFLKSQLKISKGNKKLQELKEYLIGCVDDSGYFTMPVEEAAYKSGASTKEVEACLKELKELEPTGVFSSTLEECLMKQVEELGIATEELTSIICNHLDDVAKGNIGNISRSLHISTVQVRKHILLISTLNPRPAMGYGGRKTQFIIPDIIMHHEGKWEIELNDSWIGEYKMNDYYLMMMEKTDDEELKEYFDQKAQRVNFILTNIEQRKKTLTGIMEVILERQKEYFEGTGPLKPMTMADVAEDMDLHVSTISRAVKGKYVQYPKETILLKHIFTQKISKDGDGAEVSVQMIKEHIRSLVDTEDKKKPYSDQKLKEKLEEEGIVISRRVVAKYRDEMGIKGSFARKE